MIKEIIECQDQLRIIELSEENVFKMLGVKPQDYPEHVQKKKTYMKPWCLFKKQSNYGFHTTKQPLIIKNSTLLTLWPCRLII